MKKLIFSMVIIYVFSLMVDGKNPELNLGLPTLHSIKEVTLSPSYSCRSAGEFTSGYGGTALFLSNYSREVNSPDLLFNGACGSENYFQSATAGDDMSLIADLGAKISLEEISASRALNPQRLHNFSAYSKFQSVAKVELNHTYAVMISESDKRGLFVFTVTDYEPNKRVTLKYAVKYYQVMLSGQRTSPGFEWEEKNRP